ncbi:hypothetical protein FACS189497_04840 [Betaproteobacteria bacterium]|nr:hypothetical protein FACS189488_07900 [Betaproteobacteria bacterium]GHU28705.1 hypothetical protein FACS189497_04840 [Betaproteobacteria bacterium]
MLTQVTTEVTTQVTTEATTQVTTGATTSHRGRVRWQCRRALLELDLVLERFLERHFDRLDDSQLVVFEELLRSDDYDLWAMVNGSKPCEVERWQGLVGLLREAEAPEAPEPQRQAAPGVQC